MFIPMGVAFAEFSKLFVDTLSGTPRFDFIIKGSIFSMESAADLAEANELSSS